MFRRKRNGNNFHPKEKYKHGSKEYGSIPFEATDKRIILKNIKTIGYCECVRGADFVQLQVTR